jgi:hypothetical protein
MYGLGLGVSVATATAVITTDIMNKTIQYTINSITNTLFYMSQSSENTSINKYHSELSSLDIEFKLNLINVWIQELDKNNKELSETYKTILNGVKDICLEINKSIESINTKIKEHQNLWFHTYRTFLIDDEISLIKRNNKILNERLYLFILKN